MQDTNQTAEALDEFKLRDELKSLRSQIPDQPSLNPIVNVAFKLSRQLESGAISFEDLKALAGRLMDRAFVRRALRLREQVGFTDTQTTIKEFSNFVARTAVLDPDPDKAFDAFQERWSRARNGIVLTAHPTFGLSNELCRRMVAIATGEDSGARTEIGIPHRPDSDISLEYEHKAVQFAIQNLRDAQEDMFNAFYSVSAAQFGERAYKFRPKLATVASWVGYDLDGRTDIKWTHSFVLKLQEKCMALSDIRTRFLAMKHRAGDSADIQRIARQITGKLDLAIAAAEKQHEALKEAVGGNRPLAEAANIISSADPYNLVTTEPVVTLLHQMIEVVPAAQSTRELAARVAMKRRAGRSWLSSRRIASSVSRSVPVRLSSQTRSSSSDCVTAWSTSCVICFQSIMTPPVSRIPNAEGCGNRTSGQLLQKFRATGRPQSSRSVRSRRSWRSCASSESVAVGRASRRRTPIGSPVSSQYP